MENLRNKIDVKLESKREVHIKVQAICHKKYLTMI